jgi:hypothetical protein
MSNTDGDYPDLFREPIAEILDLDTWKSATGTTSIFGPVCPHCFARFTRQAVDAAGAGDYRCGECLRDFTLEFIAVAGKRAYRTWRADAKLDAKRSLHRSHLESRGLGG